jgi:chemotaxis regulatin CheY-phosphate phosphatase CheZ
MNEKQKQFLQLRADGLSFDKIAAKLKVSKQTLIQWSKLFASEINDLKFQSLADLKEQYKFNQRAKYEQLLKHLEKIDKSIEAADLSTASIKELIQVRNDIAGQLERIEAKTSFINTGLVTKCNITGQSEAVAVKLNEL